jgi:acetyl-CoA C-acetyltransferase
MKDEEIVIVSAARTPVGSFNGSLSSLPAHKLGEVAIKAALARAHVDPADVDEVIMGQVLTAGQGQNPARQAAVAAGVPVDATAFGVNQVCGSAFAPSRLARSRSRPAMLISWSPAARRA